MSFVVVIGVFALFFAGLVAVYQGFIGREINSEAQPFAMPLFRHHRGSHIQGTPPRSARC